MILRKKLTGFLCVIALAVFTSISIMACSNAPRSSNLGFDATLNIDNSALMTSYFIGETFEAPETTITYNGKTYSPTSVNIKYPNGKVTSNKKIVLNLSGEYTVTYSVVVDGVVVSKTLTIKVSNQLYSVSGEKSSATYGTNPKDVKNQNGIVLKLARDSVFTFNKAIDLSENTQFDSIVKFFTAPELIGTPDASRLIIRLTDAYDASNYVEVLLKDLSIINGAWALDRVYTVAGPAGQEMAGIEGASIHRGDNFGHPDMYSMSGVFEKGTSIGEEFFSVSMNYKERQVFDKAGMIIDLDNPAHFATPWEKGFKTGQVFLSIFAEQYQQAAINLVILDINGCDLSNEKYIDENAPSITVETDYSENDLPFARTGVAYNIFGSTAFDMEDGALETKVNVYHNYNSVAPVLVNIKDNTFTPTVAGTYSIEYSAVDSFGNIGKKVLNVEAYDASGKAALGISTTGNASVGLAGQKLKAFSGFTVVNNSGDDYKIKITATLKTDSSISYVADNDSFEFIPLYKGDYKVTATVQDYIQTAETSFEISVSESNMPAIFDEIILPKYFIQYAVYTLPTIKAYEFSSGEPTPVDVQILVKEDGETTAKEISNTYQPFASESATIIYKASANGENFEMPKTVKVIDVGYGEELKLANYFYTENPKVTNASVETSYSDLTLSTGKDTTFDFIKSVSAEGFSFKFNVNKAKTAFEKFNIYMTDSIDSSKQVKLTYKKVDNDTSISINGGTAIKLGKSFDGNGENFFLSYNNTTRQLGVTNSMFVPVNDYVSKAEFKGFTSGEFYLTFEFEGVATVAGIHIFGINNQTFADFDSDIFTPNIYVERRNGDRGLNTVVELSGAKAHDVLDPYVKLEMIVTDPNGNYVTSNSGVVLNGKADPTVDYSITLTQYGDYIITYKATDLSGNAIDDSYGITVVDQSKPVIILSDGAAKTGGVGSNITIASYTATDDIDSNVKVNVYVITPDYLMKELTSNSFTAEQKGVYTVVYTAYDESMNFAVVRYQIKIS